MRVTAPGTRGAFRLTKPFRGLRWPRRRRAVRLPRLQPGPVSRMKKKVAIVARRLAALAAAQYVMVTVLVGCAAVIVAHEASAAINATLLSLLAALKRL